MSSTLFGRLHDQPPTSLTPRSDGVRMNIYRKVFALDCPTNGTQIIYSLRIESEVMIPVEDITDEAMHNEVEYHEVLADRLFQAFGGRQVITATHHGIDIETRRGGA